MKGILAPSVAVVVALGLVPAQAQSPAEFYKGKSISVIVGFAPGGGYDLYARLLSRHIGKHIPGQPGVIVQNMVGAGSVRASNHVYAVAPKDGTVIAAVNQNMPMYSLLGGQAAQFDAAQFFWLGSMASSNGVVYTWHTSPTKNIADAMKRETPLGGTGTNSDSHIFPTLINKLLGTKFKVINGYAGGTSLINIAIERGEVEGRGGNTWASLKSGSAAWVAERKLQYIIQIGLKREPELGNTPLLSELAKSEADKQAVHVIGIPTEIGYAHWMAPGQPPERLAAMRTAYAAMLKDKDFLAEAEKLKALITPKSGSEIEALMRSAFATPKEVLQRTAELLEWKGR
ncbi:MAG: hypothetical protein FJX29_01545 [Alphaproteobacteria bacterium]|nr:hypothetical protein [Alphaproteobacteria bacterium]